MENLGTIWGNTKSLLVFYVFKNHEDFQDFRVSLDEVLNKSEVKRLKVIILINDPKENVLKHSLFSYLLNKDISFFGNKIKKNAKGEGQEDLEIIIGSHFDLFLCFGLPSQKVMKWLGKSKATKRIGVDASDSDFFDVNLQSSGATMGKIVNFTVEMLNKII